MLSQNIPLLLLLLSEIHAMESKIQLMECLISGQRIDPIFIDEEVSNLEGMRQTKTELEKSLERIVSEEV
jgi:hypothetical protein